MQMPERKIGAQERYAQGVLDHLWQNAVDLCQVTTDGTFFRGSMHQLVRRFEPRAQAGDVVNILKESGAITSVAHGVWLLKQKSIFFDDEGKVIDPTRTVQYGHDSKERIIGQNFDDLNKRVLALEERVSTLTTVVVAALEGTEALAQASTGEDSEATNPT